VKGSLSDYYFLIIRNRFGHVASAVGLETLFGLPTNLTHVIVSTAKHPIHQRVVDIEPSTLGKQFFRLFIIPYSASSAILDVDM